MLLNDIENIVALKIDKRVKNRQTLCKVLGLIMLLR